MALLQALRILPVLLVASLAVAPTLQPTARAGVLPGFAQGDLKAFLSGRTLLVVSGAGALAAASLLIENPNTEERVLDRRAFDAPADLGNIYGGDAVVAGAAGLAGAGFLAHNPEWTRAGWDMARSIVYTGGAVTLLKLAVRRTRPNGGAYSFPSGHTAAAFCVAPVLASRFGIAAAIPAYALGVTTALGRMEDRKHYLSDVIFGAGIGTAIGLAVASDHGSKAPQEFDSAQASADRSPPESVRCVVGLGMTGEGFGLTARF
jgi:membrane-associated phospholipid phosphatase